MKRSWLFILLPAAAVLASAQTLTLADARRMALDRNVALKQAGLSVNARLLDKDIAAAGFMPSVSLSGSASAAYPSAAARLDDEIDLSQGIGISASQTLFAGGAKLSALKQSALALGQAEAGLSSARLAALKEADGRYLDALEKAQLKEAADKDFEAARLHLEAADAKRAAGLIDAGSFLKTKSDFALKEAAAKQAGYDLALARLKLAALIGAPADSKLEPLDESRAAAHVAFVRGLSGENLEKFTAAMIEAGRSANPDLRKNDLAVSLAGAVSEGKLAPFLPSVSLGWSHSWNRTEYSAADGGKLTLSGTIPLFPWQDRLAELQKADGSLQSARLSLGDALEQYSLTMRGTLLDLAASANKMESAAAALEYAQEHYNQVFEKFKLSAASGSELYDAEALLSASRSQTISSRFAFYRAWTGLLYGLGREHEAELLEIVERAGFGPAE